MRRPITLFVMAAVLAVAGAAAAAQSDGKIIEQAKETADDATSGLFGSAPTTPAPEAGPAPVPDVDLDASAVLVGLLVSPFIAAGVRHITRDNVLEHATRKAIYEYLWETGGSNLRTIADALDLSSTNATWHLDKLVKADLAGVTHTNGLKLYYPRGAGRIAKELCQARAVLDNENASAVLSAVMAEPGTHQRAIARELGINHGTVRWHLQRLADIDLIEEVETEGRTKGFEATGLARQAVAAHQGGTSPLSQVNESNV